MNPSPLDQLRDIHLPTDVSWWPLAPGWWLLLVLSLICFVLLFRWWRQSRNKSHYLKQIMSAMDELEAEKDLDDKVWLERMSALLRQLAINLHGRKTTAGLVGSEWLDYLDKSGQTDQFSRGVGQVLASSPYQESVSYNRSALLGLVRQWLTAQAKRGSTNA